MGWSYERISRDARGHLHYQSRIALNVSRLGDKATVSMEKEIHGTEDGRLVAFTHRIDMGSQTKEMRGHWTDEGVVMVLDLGGRPTETLVSMEEQPMSSDLAVLLFLDGSLSHGKSQESLVFSEELGQLVELNLKAMDQGPSGFRVAMEMKGTGKVPFSYGGNFFTDKDGELKTIELASMGFVMERTTEKAAKTAVGSADILSLSLIRTKTQIPNPRDTRYAKYFLKIKPGNMGKLEIPETPCQKVKYVDGGAMVEVRAPGRGGSCGKSSPPEKACVELNPYEGPGDRDLLRKSSELEARAQGAKNPLAVYSGFVGQYIENKNFSMLFATAPEILDSRTGDCTEHSVLLSSLLKGSGRPARWILGMAYTQEKFWYHEWVEAYENGSWKALDASLNPNSDVDASRIVLGWACDEKDLLTASAQMASLVGALDLEVLEAR